MGLAPARVEIFDTISEFIAARGILGGGFEAAGGICEGFGVGIGFEEAGGAVLEGDVVFGGTEDADSGERVVGDGLENFAESGDSGTLFADSSRTCSNILEVSGVTGVFGAGFEGAGVGGFDSVFADADGLGAGDFGAVFVATGVFPADFDTVEAIGVSFVAVGVVFAGFGAAFVDFALVVDFFFSGSSISIGSEMTFLGLPLFLTTSADMLCNELFPESRCRRR